MKRKHPSQSTKSNTTKKKKKLSPTESISLTSTDTHLSELSNIMKEIQIENLDDLMISHELFLSGDREGIYQKAKALFDMYGVLFITDVISEAYVGDVYENIIRVHNEMFGEDGMVAAEIEDIPMSAKAGVIGNKGFAYLFKQPVKKSELESEVMIGEDPVYLDHNPVYYNVNVRTLIDNPELLSDVIGLSSVLTGSSDCMISWDSCKVSYNHKKRANPFTPTHIDNYSQDRKRLQMILNVDEGDTKLFFVPGTQSKRVRKILGKIHGKDMYRTDGFKPISPGAEAILRKYAIAPPPRSLTIWKSGVVHAEFTAQKVKGSKLFKASKAEQKLKQLTVRLILGTNVPVGLTENARKQLAVAAFMGAIPHRYFHHPLPNAVVENKMHKAKTLYMKRRISHDSEKMLLQEIIATILDEERLESTYQKIPTEIRSYI
eukprot:TRINITY_DN7916_c0_g1_i1.p1 TRINITY_DN7916_c0_g1~~TRINITY_DN7916_c0_g1_i1.p1  ORF type:complete len:471 (+),score=89.64 TRINITY_DN7916_c0_g1_i1:115-1413(+)